MQTNKRLILLGFLCVTGLLHGQTAPQIRADDKARIKEALRISELFGEKIWQGFHHSPFALLLLTDSVEFLMNHPAPTMDFIDLGYDATLGSRLYYRKTVYNKSFLATFPAVNGVNTIVVGTPENTGTDTNSWILSVLHERFHQFVYSSPGYYESVERLGLSGGDKTGMWMLNFAFPYSDSSVVLQYKYYTRALTEALSRINSESFRQSVLSYIAARKKLQQLLSPSAYRYFSFQIWQEGIARYTELKFLDLMEKYEPSKEVSGMRDYIPFAKHRQSFYQEQMGRTTQWDLMDKRRECFYALGLGEGLLLDNLNSRWREKYLTDKFYIEQYSDVFK